jgi:uncharacterized membrane protein
MNKVEFLHILELALEDSKVEDRKEILYDYEEHFRIGEENGKSEEVLIEELGDPRNIAKQYGNSNQFEIKETKEEVNKTLDERPVVVPIIAALALALFNLIFVLGPYLGIAGTILGLFVAAIGITIGGVGTAVGIVVLPILPSYSGALNGFSSTALMFLGIGTTALGLLCTIGMCYVAKYFCKVTIRYVNWNMKIIKG